MSLWGPNDQEFSKPKWLTEEQKRNCFRTERGWEIPLQGVGYSGSTANGWNGTFVTRSSQFVVPTELLVAMPFDASVTGTTQANYTSRGHTSIAGATNGNTAGNPNYAPYFTLPANGVTLNIVRGITAYVPVLASDANLTDMPQAFTFLLAAAGLTNQKSTILSVTGVSSSTSPWATTPAGVTLHHFATAGAGAADFVGQFEAFVALGGTTVGAGLIYVGSYAAAPTGASAFGGVTGYVGISPTGGSNILVGATSQPYFGYSVIMISSPTAGDVGGGFYFPQGVTQGSTAASWPLGGWGGVTQGCAALVIATSPYMITGNRSTLTASVGDNYGFGNSLTGTSTFNIAIVTS